MRAEDRWKPVVLGPQHQRRAGRRHDPGPSSADKNRTLSKDKHRKLSHDSLCSLGGYDGTPSRVSNLITAAVQVLTEGPPVCPASAPANHSIGPRRYTSANLLGQLPSSRNTLAWCDVQLRCVGAPLPELLVPHMDGHLLDVRGAGPQCPGDVQRGRASGNGGKLAGKLQLAVAAVRVPVGHLDSADRFRRILRIARDVAGPCCAREDVDLVVSGEVRVRSAMPLSVPAVHA
jgi:hypothetical protein